MEPKKAAKQLEGLSPYRALETALIQAQSASTMGIIEFANTILDLGEDEDGNKIKLWPQQRAMLKALYCEPLDPDEQAIMDKWRAEDKTNYLEREVAHAKQNVIRAENGDALYNEFNYQLIVLQCGMRASKTLKDSLIRHKDKGYVYFSELFGDKVAATKQAFDQDFEVMTRWGNRRVNTGFTKPAERCINFRTRYGYELGGAVTHPLLVLEPNGRHVWKKMPEIQVGDYLCINRNVVEDDRPLPKLSFNGREIDPTDLGYFLGLLVGDGHTSRGKGQGYLVSLTTIDQEIYDFATAFLRDQCGVHVQTQDRSSGLKDIRVTLKAFRLFLESVGLGYEKSYDKKIPAWVRSAPRPVLRAFIQGLMDTDGFACTKKTAVGIASASEQLMRELQVLLLDFGIISSRQFRVSKYVLQDGTLATHWQLKMDGAAARRYGEHIGFRLPRKQQTVEAYRDPGNYGSTVDKIPGLHELLIGMKKSEGHSTKGSGKASLWNKIRKQCNNQLRGKTDGGITYTLLPYVIDYFKDVPGLENEVRVLESMRDQNLFYDEIVETWDTHEVMYDLSVDEVEEYVANGIVSHNSFTVGLACAYEFYKYVTMKNPQGYLGVSTISPIYITVLASTERQTKGTIFWYVKEFIKGSKFFQKMIEDEEIIVRDLDIECPKKKVIIASGHSKATSIVGRTAVMVAFDELAMFSADDGHTSNAADIFARVGRSTATYRNKAKRICLSSVKEQGDFMETLVREEFEQQAYGSLIFNLSTFDMNPTLSRTDATVYGDYRRDPVTAERDYENIRPHSASAFLIPSIIQRCATLDPQGVCPHSPYDSTQQATDQNGNLLEERTHTALQIAVEPVYDLESYAHADLSLARDSTGFACGHPEWTDQGVVTVIPILLEWMPRPLGRGEIAKVDLLNVEDVILEIARARNIVELTYDQWNSATSIQRLFAANIIARDASFSRPLQKKMYDSLRSRMNAGLVRFPNHPTLIEELENLQLMNGDKIDHPKAKDSKIPGRGKISKDLADCVAAVNWLIVQRYEPEFDRDHPESNWPQRPVGEQPGTAGHAGGSTLLGHTKYGGARNGGFGGFGWR